MNFAVLQFPASNCDQDALHVVKNVLGQSPASSGTRRIRWRASTPSSFPADSATAIICGRGDCAVQPDHAGGAGICRQRRSGAGHLQRLPNPVRSGLLPGALIRNRSLQFRCEHIFLKTATRNRRSPTKFRPEKSCACPSPTAKAAISRTKPRWTQLEKGTGFSGQYADAQGQLTEAANPNGSLAEHRRHLQRSPQRRGPDAASGAGQRGDCWVRRTDG
jgi:phosphoribosylformylglycinamidine synthase subunit PurQ / glutaminase